MADPEVRPLAPLYQPTQNVAPQPGQAGVQVQQGLFLPGVIVTAVAASAVASTKLPGGTGGNNQAQFYVANKTGGWVHVNFGSLTGGVRAAALTDPGIPTNTVMVFTVNPECDGASVF